MIPTLQERRESAADRAAAIQFNHVLGIAITAVLIVTLVTGATTFLENEREDVVDGQLETLGNRLASEIEQADRLASRSDRVTVQAEVRGDVAGQNFTPRVASGPDCETSNFHTDRCLVLEAARSDASTTVPLNISSDLQVEHLGDGEVRIVAVGGSDRPEFEPTSDRQLRIGVARSFELGGIGIGTDPINEPPVAVEFEVSPGFPQNETTTRFDAESSFDSDGEVAAYQWDLDEDGRFEALGRNPSRELAPGRRNVTLRVTDDDGATDNVTREIRVSGVSYDYNLTANQSRADPPAENVRFTVTNHLNREIDLGSVYLNPPDTVGNITNSCTDASDCPFGSDDALSIINLRETGTVGLDARYEREQRSGTATSFSPGDTSVFQLSVNPGGGTTELGSGESTTVWIGDLYDASRSPITGLAGEEFQLGVRYERDDYNYNTTTATERVNSPEIEEFRIERNPSNTVDAVVVSDRQLDNVRVEYGGGIQGTEVETSLFPTSVGDGLWEHEVFLGNLDDGAIRANLTRARNGTVEARQLRDDRTINRSRAFIDSGDDYTWTDAADWDAASTTEGVVHDSFGDTDPDSVVRGYPARDQGGSNLTAYWHLDGSPGDASDTNADANANGGLTPAFGTFEPRDGEYTQAYDFDGTDDRLQVTGSETSSGGLLDMNTTNEVTVAMWINRDGNPDDTVALLQHSNESYNLNLLGGDTPAFTVYDGDWHTARAPSVIRPHEWHHVVGTFNGSGVTLYVDGNQVDSEGADWVESTGQPLRIGANPGNAENFDGQVDDVRVYNRSLSDTEVERLSEPSGSAQLVTDWQSGSTSYDSSNATLAYNVSVPASTSITATVQGDVDGDGNAEEVSAPMPLTNGSNQVPVPGIGTPADRFRISIEMSTETAVKTPKIREIALVEEP